MVDWKCNDDDDNGHGDGDEDDGKTYYQHPLASPKE